MRNAAFAACLSIVVLVALSPFAAAQTTAPLRIHFLGAGEYQPVESLTAYKKHLEDRWRVQVATSFGKDAKSLPGLEPLAEADVMLLFVRRLDLPEEQMARIRSHWDKGKGIVALRTASHGFQAADIALFDQVLGARYEGPGSYTAPFTAVPAADRKEHPVLKGVGPIASRGCYRFGPLAEKAVVLQVVQSDRKVPAPASWVHEHRGGRVFYSTLGVPEDFRNDDFRRLLENALIWTGRRTPDELRRPTGPDE